MNVLVLNCGSSSLKFQVIATDPERIRQDQDERLYRGQIERIGAEAIRFWNDTRHVERSEKDAA
jgi:acetate kinase